MHQPTLTLTLTRLGAAVLALARRLPAAAHRLGDGAPSWQWRRPGAMRSHAAVSVATRRLGGCRRLGASAPCRRPRAVLAARARRPGCGAPSRLRCAVLTRAPPWRERAVPRACVPLWRERAVLARARRPGGCAPSWWICAVPSGRLRRLGACAPSRLLCVGLALARSPGGCALSRGEGHAARESAGYHPPTVRATLRMHPVVSVVFVVYIRMRAILLTGHGTRSLADARDWRRARA